MRFACCKVLEVKNVRFVLYMSILLQSNTMRFLSLCYINVNDIELCSGDMI